MSVRQDWAELEPNEGSFDFSFLDSEVARIAAAGKKILLRINTQAGKPSWVSDAVTAAGGVFYTFVDDDGTQNTIPVYWDPTFLAKKKAMIVALGAHFTNNPALAVVWTSFANARSEDWSVPHTPSQVEAWQQVGYTTDKLLEAGKEIIDTTMMAFPNQYANPCRSRRRDARSRSELRGRRSHFHRACHLARSSDRAEEQHRCL